jgi:hypothetical protein
VELRTAITSGKWRNTQEDLIQDFQRKDHETNSRDFQRVMKNQGLDIVDGSDPAKTENEIAHGVGAGNVGALATWDNFAPTVGKKKTSDDGDAPGLPGNLSGSCP